VPGSKEVAAGSRHGCPPVSIKSLIWKHHEAHQTTRLIAYPLGRLVPPYLRLDHVLLGCLSVLVEHEVL
jgi:hypothetical protein